MHDKRLVGLCIMKFLCAIFGISLSLNAIADPGNHLDQLSLNEGLSQSQVQAILQDSRGYVWFGTQDGLNRYDGYQIRQFHNDPFDKKTLPGDNITSLYEDSRQQLWVGTGQGICIYDRLQQHFVRYTHLSGKHQPAQAQMITSIVEDDWKTLWVGTPRGLWRLIPEAGAPRTFRPVKYDTTSGLNHESVSALYKDKKGNIWVATRAGLNRITVARPEANPASQQIQFENAASHPAAVYQRLQLPVQRLTDNGDYLWVASENRLFAVSLSDFSVQDLGGQLAERDAAITSLWTDRLGVVWIGTFGYGLFRYQVLPSGQLTLLEHIREERRQPNGLKSGSVYAIYEGADPDEDIVWIGTREAGVHLYSRSKNSFQQWGNLLTDDKRAMEASVFSICTDSFGYLWVGTFEGLFQIDRKTQQYQKIILNKANPRNDAQLTLLEDSQKNLWAGSRSGLYRYNQVVKQFIQIRLPPVRNNMQPYVKNIYEDRQGNIWVSTHWYLVKLEKNSRREQIIKQLAHGSDTLKLVGIGPVKEDAAGNMWIGTDDGLIKWQPQSGNFRRFANDPTNPKSPIGNTILNIHRDKKNQLWICSSKGLSKVVVNDGQEEFIHYTRRHGLPNSFVYGALSDRKGKIWISTNAGLSCFDPVTDTFKNYDTNDGLTNREFNSGAFHQSREGELFFGGQGVLVSFYPDRLVENKHLPKVGVSFFQQFQQEVNLDSLLASEGEVRVDYKEYFSFFFFATDYNNPLKNQFAYKLEGLQDRWIYSTNRFFGIADVKPGYYTLKVKSCNNQGHWNENDILSIPIYIKPPFWLSSWFYALILIAIATAGFSFYRYRVRRKVEHALAVERIKIEENERVRKLAAQDLHDEFGNGLTRITVLTELIRYKLDSDINEARYLLGKINDNAQRLYQGTKDFIWTINPENDNFYEIALRLKDFGDDIFEKTATEFNAQGISPQFQNIVFPMGASRHLILIFKEAMSNTLKYANATRTELLFQVGQENITLRWQDNGKGFDPAIATQSNGLVNMRTRADKIGGNVEIFTQTDAGTEVIFRVKSPKMGEVGNPVF